MKIFVYGTLVNKERIPKFIKVENLKKAILLDCKKVKKNDRNAYGIIKSNGDTVEGVIQKWNFIGFIYLLYREGVPFHYYPRLLKLDNKFIVTFFLRKKYVTKTA